MANALVLDSIAFSDTADFDTAGKWLERVIRAAPPVYRRTRHKTAGNNGCNRKTFGFDERPMSFECWYVGASQAAVDAAIRGDVEALAGKASFSVTLRGATLTNCELDSPNCFSEEPRASGTGTYHARAVFSIVQTGL